MTSSTKILQRLLLVAGILLSAFYVGVLVFREASSRMSVRSFESARENPAPQPPPPPPVPVTLPSTDVSFRMWAVSRISAYKASLAEQFAPPIGIVRAPKLGIEVPVFEGTDELVLNRGLGWVKGTSRPGEAGNVAVAGHRDGFFRGLKNIAVGDRVTLDRGAVTDSYVVDRITIVDKTDVSVLTQTTEPVLTLVTCYPFYYAGDAPRRYIVRCALKERLPNSAAAPRAATQPSGEM
jgi:sortase A